MAFGKKSIEDEICDKYEQCRRAFHPGYAAGNRHDEHWRKAADLVRSIGADPRLFVEAQFEIGGVNNSQILPFPAQIHGNRAVENYDLYIAAFRPKAEEAVINQFRYLANFVDRVGMTIDQAVSNIDAPFRPYFRLLTCSDEIAPAIEQRWGEAARRELQNNSDLRAHLQLKYAYRIDRIIRQDVPGEAGGEPHPVPPPTEFTRERQSLTD